MPIVRYIMNQTSIKCLKMLYIDALNWRCIFVLYKKTTHNKTMDTTLHSAFSPLSHEISRHIIGYESLIEKLFIALLCEGHVLLEGPPGLAKTRTLSVLSQAVGAGMQRVQFTPDLLPSDIVGTEIYRPQTGEFVTRKGPVFTNFFLADEINRAPCKSAVCSFAGNARTGSQYR